MTPEIISNLLCFISFCVIFFMVDSDILPTRHVYNVRLDTPIKLGKYYFGKKSLIRNWTGIGILLITIVAYYLLVPNRSPTDAKVTLNMINESVYAGNGFIFANILYGLFALIMVYICYKLFMHFKNEKQKSSMVNDSQFIKLELQAKLELFDLMYKKGAIKLPLQPKEINGEIYLKEDESWIPYPRPVLFRTMLIRWKEEN